MQPWMYETWTAAKPHLPRIAGALAILLGGWFVALIARGLTFAALKRTTIDDRIASALGIAVERGEHKVERAVSRVAYYIVLAFVFVAVFDQLEINAVTEPVLGALSGITQAIPSVLKAGAIVGVGYALALIVKRALIKLFDKSRVVDRLGRLAGEESDERRRAVGTLIATVAFWFIVLMTAIPALEALEIGALSGPLSAALHAVTTYLPKVVGAAVLLAVGYLLGRLARAAVTTFANKSGLDRALERLGLGSLLGRSSAGAVLGTLVMAFIVLHFAIGALGKLEIDEISGPMGLVLQQIYDYVPNALSGAVLLTVGVVHGRLARRVSRAVLAGVGFNALFVYVGLAKEMTAPQKAEAADGAEALRAGLRRARGEATEEGAVEAVLKERGKLQTPADIAGSAIGAIVVLVFVRQVLATLRLEGLGQMVDAFLSYLPNVLVALGVLAAGMWVGRWAGARIDQLTRPSSDTLIRSLGSVARAAIITIAAMMALHQLGVAPQLIGIAFALILGAVCLAAALAFGLGGREVAGEIVRKRYDGRR